MRAARLTFSFHAVCAAALLARSGATSQDLPGWVTPAFDTRLDEEAAALFEAAAPGPLSAPPVPPEGFFSIPPGSAATAAFSLGLAESVASLSGALVAETARGLDHNWAQCYLFVRNQIRYSPYKGLLRGPERTLLDREGNCADQAFLLLALLRASGYAETGIRYADCATNGCGALALPLAGSPDGYDAAAWLGVPSGGTAEEVAAAVSRRLSGGAVRHLVSVGATPQASLLLTEHFWVRAKLDSVWYDLDPSFKPRRATAPSSTLLADMAYDRTNLLAKVGGTYTSRSVSSLNRNAFYGELLRMTTNLVANWRASGAAASGAAPAGADEIAPQDLAGDASVFHGETRLSPAGGGPVDFLDQSDGYKNALRYSLTLEHGGFTNVYWLDEINTRRLWLSYADAEPLFPRAVLHVDDEEMAAEAAGSDSSGDSLTIRVGHPFVFDYPCVYSLSRSTGSVYAVAMGFGGDRRDGMRARAQSELGRALAGGASALDQGLRSRVLQVAGQQWLGQTALQAELGGRLSGRNHRVFYNIGIAAQADTPYVDIKNGLGHGGPADPTLDPSLLFSSALEHAVLDQLNGTNRPSVSTVRVIDLALNATDIYLATSANWYQVRQELAGYTDETIAELSASIAGGRSVLMPASGELALNGWSGYGYIDFGRAAASGPGTNVWVTRLAIGGGYDGGYGTLPGSATDPADALSHYYNLGLPDRNSWLTTLLDPVDACSGAFLAGGTDLALAGPVPLALTRSYDSRLRHAAGPFGKGWSHGYAGRMNVCSDPDLLLGRGAPLQCAASVVAFKVAADLVAQGNSPRYLVLACLAAKWWTDQLVCGAASAEIGGRPFAFLRSPDGAYLPGPGVTAALVRSNTTAFVLSERLGPSWRFNAAGNLDRVTDASGNYWRCYYNTQTNLAAVSNSFGGKLTFSWVSNRISSAADSAGRSVSYAYSGGCLTGVVDAAGCVWPYAYDADGALLAEKDPSGAVIVSNVYNTLGQVTNQVSASGGRSTLAYAAGVRTCQRDPLGGLAVSEFDGAGRLVRSVAPDGGAALRQYDARGHLVTNIDAAGRVTARAYDAHDRLQSETEAAGTPDARTTAYAYDGRHRLVAVTNALGRVTRMAYDACDRIALTLGPDGSAVTNAYDVRGLPVLTRMLDVSGTVLAETATSHDARGFPSAVTATGAGTVRYGHDAAGNLTGVTNALGRGTRIWHDRRGLPTNTLDALGGRTVRAYTPAGRLASKSDPLGRTTLFYWTPGGQPAATRYADGGIATNEYDAADRLVASMDPRGSRVTLGLDLLGRATNRCGLAWSEQAWYGDAGLATARVDAVSGRTVTDYDWLDRPVAVTDPLGHTRTNAYDALGSLTNAVDPRGRETSYAYDLAGRRVRTVYPSGRAEADASDALGRRIAFTNAENRAYLMGCDGQGLLLAATNALGEQTVRNFYDFAGNLTNTVDAASRRTVYRYDALNRSTNTVYADGSYEAFTYDAVGNLLAASNAASRLAFGYDAMNRLTSALTRVSSFQFPVSYAYDLGGLATNVVYPDGKAVCYGYDTDGRLASVSDWAGRSFTFTRDAAGRLTSLSYPNGVTGAWQYDANHAVASWNFNNAAPFAGRTITRDDAGVKIKEQVTTGLFPNPQNPRRAQNTFDAADRLVSAQVVIGTNAYAETYRYDGCGSLTNVTRGAETQDYEYDLAGRLTFAAVSGVTLTVTYDALGNRLTTYSGNTTRLWVTDHADPLKRPLMGADANGAPVRWFVWGGGMLLAVVEADGTVCYCHSDEQGSVVALTDASGTVTDQYCYGPYGTDWGHSGTNAIPFRWLGSHGVLAVSSFIPPPSSFSSSLYLTRHRAYDAELCRFISADPSGLAGGPNLYAYCMGNPLAYVDPLGLCGQTYGFGFGDYASDVGQMFLGYGDAIAGTAAGVANAVMNPSQSAMAAMGAIANLGYTISDVADSVSTAWNSGYRGQGQVVGSALITAGTIAAPYAGAAETAVGGTLSISTPYAIEVQGATTQARAAAASAQGGATLFRTGELGTSMAGESQYWSLLNPTTPGYANSMGLPNVTPNFMMGGTLNSGASAIANEAAGLGANAGRGIQTVTSPGGVRLNWFHMP